MTGRSRSRSRNSRSKKSRSRKSRSRNTKGGRSHPSCEKTDSCIKLSNKGYLSELGYSTSESKKNRYKALDKAIKDEGHLPIIRKLTALRNLNNRYNPEVSKIFKEDAKYVSKRYEKEK